MSTFNLSPVVQKRIYFYIIMSALGLFAYFSGYSYSFSLLTVSERGYLTQSDWKPALRQLASLDNTTTYLNTTSNPELQIDIAENLNPLKNKVNGSQQTQAHP
ncbi:MAG: hypothetical protein ACOYOK_06455 [Pseudobdellovibrionaceae bacterium]